MRVAVGTEGVVFKTKYPSYTFSLIIVSFSVEQSRLERLIVQLDPELRHFSLVAVHDKFEQFGEAKVQLSRLELTDPSGRQLC
jgi:hypothetical protein